MKQLSLGKLYDPHGSHLRKICVVLIHYDVITFYHKFFGLIDIHKKTPVLFFFVCLSVREAVTPRVRSLYIHIYPLKYRSSVALLLLHIYLFCYYSRYDYSTGVRKREIMQTPGRAIRITFCNLLLHINVRNVDFVSELQVGSQHSTPHT